MSDYPKKIVFSSTTEVARYQEQVDRILDIIGYNAWVSDGSRLSDFPLDERDRLQLEEELGVPVHLSDYIVDVARRVHDKK